MLGMICLKNKNKNKRELLKQFCLKVELINRIKKYDYVD